MIIALVGYNEERHVIIPGDVNADFKTKLNSCLIKYMSEQIL